MATTTDKYVLDAKMNARQAIGASFNLRSALIKLGIQAGVTYLAFKTLKAGINLVKQSLQDASQVEIWRISFETMLGSVELAKEKMEEIYEFARTTPFRLPEVVDNTKKLMAMGIESENVIKTMRMLGDVSAGVGVPLWRLALNFGQVKTQGKLTGRELRDFQMAGVDLIGVIAKMEGVTIQQVKAMEEIPFEMVNNAFISMTSEGGKFNNLMGQIAETLPTMLSNFYDKLFKIRVEIGEQLMPVAIEFVDEMSAFFSDQENINAMISIAQSFASITENALAGVTALGKFGTAYKKATGFLETTNPNNPFSAEFGVKAREAFMQVTKNMATSLLKVNLYTKAVFEAFSAPMKGMELSSEEISIRASKFQLELDALNLISDTEKRKITKSMKLALEKIIPEETVVSSTIKMDYMFDDYVTPFKDEDLTEGIITPMTDDEKKALLEYQEEVLTVANFISQNLTSSISGFYDQLLAGKNSIRDWGQFFEGVIKRLIAQMLTLQTLSFFGNMFGISLGGADIFGSILGKLTGTTSSVLPSGGALASDSGGFDGLISAINSQPIVVNIDPNAFIQSADNVIISQSAEIGSIQREAVRF